jgi:hypothetical protein
LDRLLNVLERLRSTILDDEQAGNQPMGRAGHDYGVSFGGCLDARRDVGSIAKRIDRLSGAGANYYAPRIDPDPNRELRVCRLLVELRDRVENREARAYRTLGIIFRALLGSRRTP